MDKEEAKAVLADFLQPFRRRSYDELRQLMGSQTTDEATGPSGVRYQLEAEVVWDNERKGNLRVLGAVDDGGWWAVMPITDSFIIAPDGRFIGE